MVLMEYVERRTPDRRGLRGPVAAASTTTVRRYQATMKRGPARGNKNVNFSANQEAARPTQETKRKRVSLLHQ